jgi:hypothetical protein
MDHLVIQKAFIRVCRDSQFKIGAVNAACLVGMILNIHPLQVWLAMPSLDDMYRIAANAHPACKNAHYR